MKTKSAEYVKNILLSFRSHCSKNKQDRLFQLSIDKAILIIDAEIIRMKTWKKTSYIKQLRTKK